MLAVANAYYPGGDDDLVVWDVDESALTAPVRWEAPDPAPPPGVAAGVLFPHVYGPIERRAVVRVRRLVPGPPGRAGVHRLRADRLTQPVDGGGRPHAPPEEVLAVHEAHVGAPGRRPRPDGARGTGRARTEQDEVGMAGRDLVEVDGRG